MGNANSGRRPETVCRAGLHDLTDPDNVQIIRRANGKIERMCKPCGNARSRKWWRKNRGKRSEGI